VKKGYKEFDLPNTKCDPLMYLMYCKGFISEEELRRFNPATIPQYCNPYDSIMAYIESLKEGE
jgi:hypothetical protein